MSDESKAPDADENINENKKAKQKKVTEKLQAMGMMSGGHKEELKSDNNKLSSKLPKLSTVIIVALIIGGVGLWVVTDRDNDQLDSISTNTQSHNAETGRKFSSEGDYAYPYSSYNSPAGFKRNSDRDAENSKQLSHSNNRNYMQEQYTNPYYSGYPQNRNNTYLINEMNQMPVTSQQQYMTMIQQWQTEQILAQQKQEKMMQEQWLQTQKKREMLMQEQQKQAQHYRDQQRQAQTQKQPYYEMPQYSNNWTRYPPPSYYVPQQYPQPLQYYGR